MAGVAGRAAAVGAFAPAAAPPAGAAAGEPEVPEVRPERAPQVLLPRFRARFPWVLFTAARAPIGETPMLHATNMVNEAHQRVLYELAARPESSAAFGPLLRHRASVSDASASWDWLFNRTLTDPGFAADVMALAAANIVSEVQPPNIHDRSTQQERERLLVRRAMIQKQLLHYYYSDKAGRVRRRR
jgi:hypothetical protein